MQKKTCFFPNVFIVDEISREHINYATIMLIVLGQDLLNAPERCPWDRTIDFFVSLSFDWRIDLRIGIPVFIRITILRPC